MNSDVMREHDFQLNWEKVDDSGCTQEEIEEIEKLIRHIIVEHRPMLSEKGLLKSPLCNLRISGQFIEDQYGYLETDPFKMAGLIEQSIMLQGSCDYINTLGMIHKIGYGHMRIDCFRAVADGTELLIDWRPKNSHPRSDDVRVIELRCVMSVKFGPQCDGISSATALLTSLRNWDALADVVGESATTERILTITLEHHFERFGRVNHWAAMSVKLSPKTFPEIEFTVQPMWSPTYGFRSKSELASFLTKPNPGLIPKPVDSVPNYFGCLPRGNSDYIVDYDKCDSKWALLYSPRLSIYFKVTVQLSGTILDDRTDFVAAALVRNEPANYIEEEIAKREGRGKVRSKSRSLQPVMEQVIDEHQSSPDDTVDWILDYEDTVDD